MTETKKNTNLVAIITMCFIFAMISFVTNMAAAPNRISNFFICTIVLLCCLSCIQSYEKFSIFERF